MKWIIVSIFALVFQQFMPWWSIAIVGFGFGFLIDQSRTLSFVYGFLGVFFLWGGIAVYVYIVNDAILANRLAMLMGLPNGLLVVMITAIVGGSVSGMASLSGRYLREITNWQIAPKQEPE